MEPKFIIQTTVSKELSAQMARFTFLRGFPLKKRLLLVCTYTAPFLLVLLLRLLFAPPLTAIDGIIALIGLIPCAMICFVMPRSFRQMYQKSFKECERTVTTHAFYDDHYTCDLNGETSSSPYDSLKDIEEISDAFAVHLTDSEIAFLPKDAFTRGTAEDFRTFFESEKGKKFKFLR